MFKTRDEKYRCSTLGDLIVGATTSGGEIGESVAHRYAYVRIWDERQRRLLLGVEAVELGAPPPTRSDDHGQVHTGTVYTPSRRTKRCVTPRPNTNQRSVFPAGRCRSRGSDQEACLASGNMLSI